MTKQNLIHTTYNEVIETGPVVTGKPKFDWVAFLIWILSLLFSLVPIYISLIQHLIEFNGEIKGEFWFACFKEYDILWVFATVLLFCCTNQITNALKHPQKKSIIALTVVGVALFGIIEATWIGFKYFLKTYQAWPLYFGAVLIVLSLVIATPLQINFIKNEE